MRIAKQLAKQSQKSVVREFIQLRLEYTSKLCILLFVSFSWPLCTNGGGGALYERGDGINCPWMVKISGLGVSVVWYIRDTRPILTKLQNKWFFLCFLFATLICHRCFVDTFRNFFLLLLLLLFYSSSGNLLWTFVSYAIAGASSFHFVYIVLLFI